MKSINETILKQYQTAIYNQLDGCYEPMQRFRELYPTEYKVILNMYAKRRKIKDSLEALKYVDEPIYWFTLTFNQKRDKASAESKRKAAITFLNDLAAFWVLVEELGTEKERYHIHGFLVFKLTKGFGNFRQWHSRQRLSLLDSKAKVSKRVYYVTNYMTKDVPRIRRSKTMVKLCNCYAKNKGFIRNGFLSTAKSSMIDCIAKNFNFF